MRDLDSLYNDVLEDIKAAGINPGAIESVEVDSRLRMNYGICKLPDDEHAGSRIYIADFFLDEQMPIENAKKTLAHEVLHATYGYGGHCVGYMKLAKQLEESNPLYKGVGGECDFCVTKELFGPALNEYKYVYECCKCGDVIVGKRQSLFDDYYAETPCPLCGGEYRKLRG